LVGTQLPEKYKGNFNVSIEGHSSGVTKAVTPDERRAFGASLETLKFSLCFSRSYIPTSVRMFKNKLTLFHRQGLTLASILFPDSALGTQLPEFHLHFFYIKKTLKIYPLRY
jgi:hypothetical protein